jgi:hypothetical protein
MSYKTRAELRLEHLQSLRRELTDQESEELRRALHAVYVRQRRLRGRGELAAA